MKVDNDFPDVDRVLRKLKELVRYCEERMNTHPAEKGTCQMAINLVDGFIDAVGKYLDSVCNGDDRIAKFRNSGADIKEVQDMISAEDRARTLHHSDIIMKMIMIDRVSSVLGLPKVFDYAEEFQDSFSDLTPSTPEEKSKMSERARIKRREMGNFGLYIGASVTAGMQKEHFISDDEARIFASCEDDTVKASPVVLGKVKSSTKSYKKNIDRIIKRLT